MEFLANERDRIIKALLWWNILEIECEILMYHCWFVKGTATSQAVYIRKRNTSFAQVILFKYIPEFDYHQVTIHPMSHYFDALTNYITPLQGTSSVPRVFFFFFLQGLNIRKNVLSVADWKIKMIKINLLIIIMEKNVLNLRLNIVGDL